MLLSYHCLTSIAKVKKIHFLASLYHRDIVSGNGKRFGQEVLG